MDEFKLWEAARAAARGMVLISAVIIGISITIVAGPWFGLSSFATSIGCYLLGVFYGRSESE